MPRKVSGNPNRQPRKPKRRGPAQAASQSSASIRQTPAERPRAENLARSYSGRGRAPAAPVVDYHYVVDDLRRVGVIAVAMFAVLGVLAVILH
ncbi:MAG: hypothetical protein Q8R28_05385 [Dehalococcoidia bacterium]|nr:hypothetical protein [Dehalococcoidia bacterium]